MATEPFDAATLAYYAREAASYADAGPPEVDPRLTVFLARLPPGARILELGCGAGRDSAHMIARGFDVDPTDGVPELAAQAERRLGRPVRILRFDRLDATAAYDAVWAHASLLHVPPPALPDILRRIHRALRPGGWHFANFKAGTAGGRDFLGRYYNYLDPAQMRAAYAQAGAWSVIESEAYEGGTYGGGRIPWLAIMVRKPAD
jgi:SAM-dependent methyltransferase